MVAIITNLDLVPIPILDQATIQEAWRVHLPFCHLAPLVNFLALKEEEGVE